MGKKGFILRWCISLAALFSGIILLLFNIEWGSYICLFGIVSVCFGIKYTCEQILKRKENKEE